MKIGFQTTVHHTIKSNNPKPYIVVASKGGIALQFLAFGDDADKAIEAVKNNALAVISAVRARSKPEDFEQQQLYREASVVECQKASRLESQISEWEDELTAIEDRTDELSAVRRETLVENIKAAHEEIKELRKDKPTGESTSKFETRIARMSELLNMNFTANPVDITRAIPVSYWDDERSILNHCT